MIFVLHMRSVQGMVDRFASSVLLLALGKGYGIHVAERKSVACIMCVEAVKTSSTTGLKMSHSQTESITTRYIEFLFTLEIDRSTQCLGCAV